MALIANPHIPRHARGTAEAPADRRPSVDPRIRLRQVQVQVVEYGGPAGVRVTTVTESPVPAHLVADRSGAAEVFAALAAEICTALDGLSGVLR